MDEEDMREAAAEGYGGAAEDSTNVPRDLEMEALLADHDNFDMMPVTAPSPAPAETETAQPQDPPPNQQDDNDDDEEAIMMGKLGELMDEEEEKEDATAAAAASSLIQQAQNLNDGDTGENNNELLQQDAGNAEQTQQPARPQLLPLQQQQQENSAMMLPEQQPLGAPKNQNDDSEPPSAVAVVNQEEEAAVESDILAAAETESLDSAQQVIDLLDSDDDNDEDVAPPPPKRQRLDSLTSLPSVSETEAATAAIKAYQTRNEHMPEWMKKASAASASSAVPAPEVSAPFLNGRSGGPIPNPLSTLSAAAAAAPSITSSSSSSFNPQRQHYVIMRMPPGFIPTWKQLLPDPAAARKAQQEAATAAAQANQQQQHKRFQLTLLNVNEFTIQGLPVRYDSIPTPLTNLRVPIRKISRGHGKAIFETANSKKGDKAADGGDDDDDNDGSGGKWRIPLGAYQNFVTYLTSDPYTKVIGIPEHQLQIASLERARQEKGYPSVETIVEVGVPPGLAKALAPFQRGGVDFVVAKNGRALIADDMGLGKTVQSIASMSVYMKEWPLLILSPSTARYHWESEIMRWLGAESNINKDAPPERRKLLIQRKSQINVLTSSRDAVLRDETRVVICSYGLAPALVENGSLEPGQFPCAIVDESHMLKNKATKRTSCLTPILNSTRRCVLLSGTPALARPAELWPQLTILGTEQHGWWASEQEFLDKYVKKGNSRTRAELHALLTGTVMIRRLKNDILKDTLKPKQRQSVQMDRVVAGKHREFQFLLAELQRGKGELAAFARTKEVKQAQADAFGEEDDQAQGEGEDLGLDGDSSDRQKRAHVLTRLYGLTGEVKIPTIAHLLNQWLDDPTKGKLCIFAHHLNMLDSLRDICRLTGAVHGSGPVNPNSDPKRKYIRIDGSTMPKVRQEQINAFQNDPTVRIALLGITAAGVAVTLTASSTVWFTELFWTPAIMIQAEDRVHRIGQQTQVECVYFVGKGTLDDVLWKLVEKKFQNLGEFVEGKEKEKMVIHRTYKNVKDFQTALFDDDEEGSGEKESQTDGSDADSAGDSEAQEEVHLDSTLEHDIEELGANERQMLKAGEDEDGGDFFSSSLSSSRALDRKPTAFASSEGSSNQVGSSQEAAITLSDDEDDGGTSSGDSTSGDALFRKPLPGCEYFRVTFHGPRLGLVIFMVAGRAVVAAVSDERTKNFGSESKPAIGAVLVMINSFTVPLHDVDTPASVVENYIQTAMKQQKRVDLCFAEHHEIKARMTSLIATAPPSFSAQAQEAAKRATSVTSESEQSRLAVTPDIIEID